MNGTRLQQLITTKRQGRRWSAAEIGTLVSGLCSGELSDGQAGALLMAVCLNGLSLDETVKLTRSMARSGPVLKWSGMVEGPVVDKHSTGGVGDLVSLVLAPMLAAAGCYVPMISGRALGPMGGTVDKLESIPGYDAFPGLARFREVVRSTGVAIVGPSEELVPADRRLYALRDETSTVDSVALITASILSKKLAEGLDALALDVKVGSGAVFSRPDAARQLRDTLEAVAARLELPLSANISEMDQPLAPAVGNALEVRQAIDYLVGAHRPGRLHRLVMDLGGSLLGLVGIDPARLRRVLDDGSAAETFARMVAVLGGPRDLVENPQAHLPIAACTAPVPAPVDGYIERVDAGAVGRIVFELGGGRTRAGQAIDPSVGISRLREVGDRVHRGEVLARVHAASEAALDRARSELLCAIALTATPPGSAPQGAAADERVSPPAKAGDFT